MLGNEVKFYIINFTLLFISHRSNFACISTMSITVFWGAIGLCIIPFVIVVPCPVQFYRAVIKFNYELTFKYKKELIIIVMLMPMKFTFDYAYSHKAVIYLC